MKKASLFLACSSLLTLLPLSSCSPNAGGYEFHEVEKGSGSVGYEIFVGSFRDSDGDGIGDLKGVEEALPYLGDLGISRVWLTPIMPSPSYHKYDVVDYYAIDEDFGTLEDFDSLVASAHEEGIEVIIDLVLNHTSKRNQWFLESQKAVALGQSGGKADWYSWGNQASLNGRAFTFDSYSGKYYESNFSSDMPELNLDNEDVRAEIRKIASFWLSDHDVDGFRLDATTYYYLDDQAESVSFLQKFRDYCLTVNPEAYIVGEAWLESDTQLASFSASGASFFAFPCSSGATSFKQVSYPGALRSTTGWSSLPKAVSRLASYFEEESGQKGNTSFFLSNHDMTRIDEFFQNEIYYDQRRLLASMIVLTPGTPWLYYGEEIGMVGKKEANTDRGQRQGMPWGNDGEKEISRCANPEKGADTNGEIAPAYEQKDDPKSLYNCYRKAINVRNEYNGIFEFGSFREYSGVIAGGASGNVNGFDISYDGKDYALLFNRGEQAYEIPLEGNVLASYSSAFETASFRDGKLSIPAFGTALVAK